MVVDGTIAESSYASGESCHRGYQFATGSNSVFAVAEFVAILVGKAASPATADEFVWSSDSFYHIYYTSYLGNASPRFSD